MKFRQRVLKGLAAFLVALVVLPVLGALLSGCVACDAAQIEDHGVTIDRREVVLKAARRQIVLAGDLIGGDLAELVVVNSDDRRMRIYAFDDGSWKRILEKTLPTEVLFVDVADIAGRDRLITCERGRINWFDPESRREHLLLTLATRFEPATEGDIPHVDITRDVNQDERDDLIVPDSHGFRVITQSADGSFSASTTLAPSIDLTWTDRTNPWLQSLLQTTDYDRDGRNDLVFWNGDHFDVHLQDARGRFAAVPKAFTPDVAFESFELYSLSTEEREVGQSGDNHRKVLSSFEDLNGDGVADLVVCSLRGDNPLDFYSISEVHFGAAGPPGSGVEFKPIPDVTIQSDGIQMGRQQRDIDGDGKIDLMMITCNDLGFFKMAGGYLNGSMALDLEFYRMEGDGYSNQPTVSRRIKGVFNEDEYYQSVLLEDVNGDERLDLLVQKGPNELRIFPGVSGPNLFAATYQKVTCAMPDNANDTRMVNLNKDGNQGILMHRRFTDCYWRTTDVDEPHLVTLLIFR